MDLQTLTTSVLQVELFHSCLFAEAFFCYIQNLTVGVNLQCGNHIIPIVQSNCLHACCRSAHRSCVLFIELDTHTFSGGNEDLIIFFNGHDRDQVVVFSEVQGNQTALSDICKTGHICFLDDALFGDHGQIFFFAEFLHRNGSHDFFIRTDFQEVHDSDTTGSSACFGNFITLDTVNLTFICKEQQRIMGGSKEEVFYVVFFPCLHTDDPSAAAVLALISIQRGTFHIVQIGQSEYAGFFIDEVFHIDLTGILDQFCSSVVSVFFTDGYNFIFDDTQHQFSVRQDHFVVSDLLLQFCIFRIDLFFFQTLQSSQLHFQNGLCLHIGQTETFHQSFFRIIITCTDNADHFIDVIDGDTQTFQNVGSFFCLIQIETCSSGHHVFLMLQIYFQCFLQIQHHRFSVNQCQHICTERFL